MSVLAYPVQAQNFSLSGAGSSIGDTVLNLKSFKNILGVNLTMTQFGSTGYGTIEAGNGVQEEAISFTGITQNSDGTAQLTGVKHTLFIPPYTETSGMTITHPGSVVFIVTNTAAWENSIYTYANTIASGGAPASSTVIGITKLSVDPAVAGTPIAVGTNDTRLVAATMVATVGNILYPIGSIYTSIVNTNPATLFGFGTWSAWGTGQVPVGVDVGQTEFNTVEKTGGEKTHTLTTAELAAHTHDAERSSSNTASVSGSYFMVSTSDAGSATVTGSTGGGGAHNNLQPYITCYMFKRTA